MEDIYWYTNVIRLPFVNTIYFLNSEIEYNPNVGAILLTDIYVYSCEYSSVLIWLLLNWVLYM